MIMTDQKRDSISRRAYLLYHYRAVSWGNLLTHLVATGCVLELSAFRLFFFLIFRHSRLDGIGRNKFRRYSNHRVSCGVVMDDPLNIYFRRYRHNIERAPQMKLIYCGPLSKCEIIITPIPAE
jgi:hypothetical protein